MRSVFLPLPLPGLVLTDRMSSKGTGRRRTPFRSMSEAGDGQACVQSRAQAQPFPPFLLTALSFALENCLEAAYRDGAEWQKQ